ncbi:hypothetical protein QL285_092312 [Trifolium repens]|nr:hypothetical protein QL285_092312 [Trifolium repens]
MLLCIKSWRDQRNYHIHPRKLYRKRSLAKYDKQTRRLFMKVREEREKDFLDKQRWEEEEMLKDAARRRRRRAVSYFPDKQRWEEMFKVAATRRRRRAVSY